MSNKKIKTVYLFTYIIIFYGLWSFREIILRPIFSGAFNGIEFVLIETLTKLLIWTLPAILLIKYYEEELFVGLKEMLINKVKWVKFSLIAIAFFIYYLLIIYFSFGKIAVNPAFRVETIISSVLFVGITEEVVFRGWLLNAMLKKMKPWYAVIINAALFLAIHFPIWIYRGQFYNIPMMVNNCIVIILLSTIFSWTFIKSKNIFLPIMLHMIWNLFSVLFFGSQ